MRGIFVLLCFAGFCIAVPQASHETPRLEQIEAGSEVESRDIGPLLDLLSSKDSKTAVSALRFWADRGHDTRVSLTDPRQATHGPFVVESKLDDEAWETVAIDSPGATYAAFGPEVWLTHPATHCDFRLSAPAKIVVALVNPKKVRLRNWFIRVEDEGSKIDGAMQATFLVQHGHHTINLALEDTGETRKLGAVDVAEGSTTNLRFTVPRGVK